MRFLLLLAALLLITTSAPAAERAAPVFAASGPDTIRTNLWLTEAMLGDVAREMVAAVPVGPWRVSLRPGGPHDAAPLLESALFEELAAAGHEAYLDESATAPDSLEVVQPEVDYELRYRFELVALEYPRVGRRLGLWTRWVDREMGVSVRAQVLESHTGRLLMDDRLKRSYGDRVPASVMSRVDDPLFTFTTAQIEEGGVKSILEELVVVGALTGLVAIYFANTGN